MTPEEEIKHWPELIGSFLINFGSVEMILFQWIDKFTDNNQTVRDLVIDLPLRKRLALVTQLIKDSTILDERKKKALELWNEVAKISEMRNVVAHSPWITNQNQQGFVDIKKMKGVKDGSPIPIAPLIFSDIVRARIRLYEIFNELAQPF